MQFSLSRFRQLFRLHMTLHGRSYLLGLLATAGLLVCFSVLRVFWLDGMAYDTHDGWVVGGFLIAGAIFAGQMTRGLRSPASRTQSMMLPVSATERIVLYLLLLIVLYPAVYITIGMSSLWLGNYLENQSKGLHMPYAGVSEGVLFLLWLYIFAASAVLAGCLMFRRNALVKSMAAVALVLVLLLQLSNWAGKLINANKQPEVPVVIAATADSNKPVYDEWGNRLMTKQTMKERTFRRFGYMGESMYSYIRFQGNDDAGGHEFFTVSLPRSQQMIFNVFFLLVPVLCWYVTWLKLKESER
ncbi:hypothetical protein ACWKWU_21290 [Chitinophaga lutea]